MLLVLALLSLSVWLGLLFLRAGFWRADQCLAPDSPSDGRRKPEAWPRVTAIIPARNEASVIGDSLRSIVAQDYPGAIEVLVVDDSSDDGTGEIARATLSERNRPQRSGEVLSAPPLPAGWAGKLWAIHTAEQHLRSRAVDDPAPSFIWLTDADIQHGPSVLRRLVETAEREGLGLTSLMVRLRLESFWERRLVPAFIFFFQKLYPFAAVNDPKSAVAAAAGGCVLLKRKALENIGGIAAIKDALIDDCALAARIKGSGEAIWLGLTNDSHSLRSYVRLSEFWAMVARSAYAQLNHSAALLLVTLVSMTLTYLVPPLVVLTIPWHGAWLASLAALAAWLCMAFAYRPTLRFYGFRPIEALWLPLSAALYTIMTLDSARQSWLGRGGAWKGRHYGSDHGAAKPTPQDQPHGAIAPRDAT